jgi:hypothetical protein
MGNRYEQFYGYTGLFPILKEERSESHAEELRGILASLPNGAGSMFSRTGLVHGARLFVIDDVIYNGHPSREDHLIYGYLAMSLTFDGDLAALAARIAEVARAEFDQLFSHCYGYRRSDSPDVLAYLKACQIETTYLYVDVGDAGLERTMRALAAQRLVAELMEQCQGRPIAERKTLVRALAARLASLELPPPGAFHSDRAEYESTL